LLTSQVPSCETEAKPFRLRPRKNPYWVGISGGRGGLSSLGFRRPPKGKGVSVAKILINGQRIEERICGDKAVSGALTFPLAAEAGQRAVKE
jgi:hypothetical protein